jgi:cysteine desulfurase
MADVIYLDYNASSPCDPRVVAAMVPLLTEVFANPASRNHRPGQRAAELLEAARATVARALGARSAEIVFTSGATEANNLALKGLASAGRRRIVPRRATHLGARAVTSSAPVAGGRWWAWGRTAACASTSSGVSGDDTAVVSVMLANNDRHPQPIVGWWRWPAGWVRWCIATPQAVGRSLSTSPGWGSICSPSGHKMWTKGIGGLYWARRCPPVPRAAARGRRHEGLRSGTVNVLAAVGPACAFGRVEQQPQESDRLAALRERLSGSSRAARRRHSQRPPFLRLPGTSNLSFAGVDGQSLAVLPDIAVGIGSACTSSIRAPHVLLAMGVPRELAAAPLQPRPLHDRGRVERAAGGWWRR